jgi:uncharacterized protein (DUF2267 family)
MPIAIRDDAVYVILKKISEANQTGRAQQINFSPSDLGGLRLEKADLLGHLDYLNQKSYINAEFSGNAYATQSDVPDAINPDEVDARVANTFGAADGPLPHLIEFQRAELTAKGRDMLAEMETNPPQTLSTGPQVEIPESQMSFLKKVMVKGHLSDPYDARDVTEVVFRVMRDMMSTPAADRVAAELATEDAAADSTADAALHIDIAELWRDTNPLVRFLSRVRPPLQGEPPFGIDSDLFLTRVDKEAAVPKTSNGEIVTRAVFAAAKEELSAERIQEIATWLPEGKVKDLWAQA